MELSAKSLNDAPDRSQIAETRDKPKLLVSGLAGVLVIDRRNDGFYAPQVPRDIREPALVADLCNLLTTSWTFDSSEFRLRVAKTAKTLVRVIGPATDTQGGNSWAAVVAQILESYDSCGNCPPAERLAAIYGSRTNNETGRIEQIPRLFHLADKAAILGTPLSPKEILRTACEVAILLDEMIDPLTNHFYATIKPIRGRGNSEITHAMAMDLPPQPSYTIADAIMCESASKVAVACAKNIQMLRKLLLSPENLSAFGFDDDVPPLHAVGSKTLIYLDTAIRIVEQTRGYYLASYLNDGKKRTQRQSQNHQASAEKILANLP